MGGGVVGESVAGWSGHQDYRAVWVESRTGWGGVVGAERSPQRPMAGSMRGSQCKRHFPLCHVQ